MNNVMDILLKTLSQVWVTFQHNWPFLVVSVLVAVALKLFMNADKVSTFLIRYRKIGVLGATAAAVGTPLCSCGTTAVILGMMASMMPWAPIVAFLVASPLTSPQELVYSAGLFGWPFALAFFIASILLGLVGGLLAEIFERAGWLAGQARYQATPAAQSQPQTAQPAFLPRPRLQRPAVATAQACCSTSGEASLQLPVSYPLQPSLATRQATTLNLVETAVVQQPAASCGCSSQPAPKPAEASSACACSAQPAPAPAASTCGCSGQAADAKPADQNTTAEKPRVTAQMFLKETALTTKNLLLMFTGFAFIGYFLNNLIPAAWISAVFGPGNVYSVPLAATLGLPLYINTEASLPLVRALIDGGMSQGAALAFLITGAGTSFGAIAGTLTIARWRVTALVIGTLWIGGMVSGFIFDLLLAMHIF